MAQRFTIMPAQSADDLDAARELFARYAAGLPLDLGYQGFADELATLPGRYAPPRGRLLLARIADGGVTCALAGP